MAVDTPAKIAVLGAGPVGLEAALYARFLGYEVVVLDRGQVCEHVLRWGHLRMVTPLAMNHSLLGLAAIQAQDESFKLPAAETFLTGREWVERYLLPLSQTDLLADHLRLNTEVLAVGKEELLKHELPGHEDRGDWSFRILVREPGGEERVELADVVIDTTGVLGQPNWIGHGGMPAVGELSVKDQLHHGFPDFLDRDRERFAGRRILLVGSDWTAAYNALELAELIEATPTTHVTWIARGEAESLGSGPIQPLTDDPLPERSRMVAAANAWASSGVAGIEYWPSTVVEAIRPSGHDGAFAVELSGMHQGVFGFDAIVGSVGYRPDRRLVAELQVDQCFASEHMPGDKGSGQSKSTHAILHPEPNFYVLGAKSFGRDPGFLFQEGLNQIRQLFTIIGDRETLDLYASSKSLVR